MINRFAAFVILASFLAAQTGESADAGTRRSVTGVRYWSLSDTTRVVVEVSGSFQFKWDHLHNPERAYFDILNAAPRIGLKRSYTANVEDKLVTRIRVAETAPGVARVVLDLAEGVEISPSQLANPDRLIVELRAGGASGTTAKQPGSSPPVSAAAAKPAATGASPAATVSTAAKPAATGASPAATVSTADSRPTITPAIATAAPPVFPAAEPVGSPAAAPAPRDTKTAAPPAARDTKAAAPPAKTAPLPAPAIPAETGTAAKRTSAGESSLVRALGLKVSRVVIDPGHGGHDQGTEGPRGLLEKDLVLDIAKRVGKLIEERMGAEVIYTRTDDTFVPLEGRTALANEKKADLFLSIHANSSGISGTAGVETFYLNITGTKDAMDVAARENAASDKSVFELTDLIRKIAKQDKAEESREFARRVQTALYAFSARNIPGSKNRGVKTAPFVVLIGANMPSVLAEIGFLSNPREETLLKKPDYRQKLAEALFRGVSRYADGLSHFQVAEAPAGKASGAGAPVQSAGQKRLP